MAKRRTNKTGYLVFLILVGAGVYSYFHSQEVYSGIMKTYYEKVRGLPVEEQVRRAEELYAKNEHEKLEIYLKDLLMAYPDNHDLIRLQGLNLIKLGQRSKGAESILSLSDDEAIPEKLIEETVQSLYEQRQYRDILRVFSHRSPGRKSNLLFYYGAALFESGEYAKASDYIRKAIIEGRTDYETYHYAGKALLRKGETRASLRYLERAREMNEEDTHVARSLADAYRKLGRYDDAAKVLRRIK
ncbi:MAG TPA: tetratricopeptide repeat protein [Spirochaetota bacterium]|nr:tetratricopeptide repeat protein [Spirochaetota bacterium]